MMRADECLPPFSSEHDVRALIDVDTMCFFQQQKENAWCYDRWIFTARAHSLTKEENAACE